MARLPVSVVAGFAGAGKSTLIGHWLGSRPAGARWALLANTSAAEPIDPAAARGALHAAPARAGGFYRVVGGCACCTAQASARAALIELLRAGPWDRLVVELDGAAHPAALVDLLRSPPFDQHLCIDGIATVIDAARSAPFEREPMHPLARAQVEAADRIVLNRAGQLPESRRLALLQRLAQAPPFGRVVQATDDGLVKWALAVDETHVERTHEAASVAEARGRPVHAIDWRRPADEVFDRARLQALTAGWPARLPLLRGAGAFRTERDWYLWRFDGSTSLWEAGAYRLESRVALMLRPHDHALELIQADLAAARIAPEGDPAHGIDDRNGV